jgi:hypothetical protein
VENKIFKLKLTKIKKRITQNIKVNMWKRQTVNTGVVAQAWGFIPQGCGFNSHPVDSPVHAPAVLMIRASYNNKLNQCMSSWLYNKPHVCTRPGEHHRKLK